MCAECEEKMRNYLPLKNGAKNNPFASGLQLAASTQNISVVQLYFCDEMKR